jgi:GT2 family glycosyltransferase
VIAFTDDDVRVAPNWIRELKRALDENPDVGCVGGKVVPNWPTPPPPWLTPENCSPLALLDHGDVPFRTGLDRQVCLVGANLAVRREVFDAIGLFTPDYQRVRDNVGSIEDYELQDRLWRAGGHGLYAPTAVVTADVQRERMAKSYHRRWHTQHGRQLARMRLERWEQPGRRLFGVPLSLYKWAARNAVEAAWDAARRRPAEAFAHECRVRFALGYVAERRASG